MTDPAQIARSVKVGWWPGVNEKRPWQVSVDGRHHSSHSTKQSAYATAATLKATPDA